MRKLPTVHCLVQVGNVLGETAGKEVKVCTDAVCSRILEALIPAAQPEQLIGFIDAFLAGQGEAFCELSAGWEHCFRRPLMSRQPSLACMQARQGAYVCAASAMFGGAARACNDMWGAFSRA